MHFKNDFARLLLPVLPINEQQLNQLADSYSSINEGLSFSNYNMWHYVHTIFLQCSTEGSILNTGSRSVFVCVRAYGCVWRRGGVTDCGPTDHRKPQEKEGCGRAKHGATCLVISTSLSLSVSYAVTFTDEELWILEILSCNKPAFFFPCSIITHTGGDTCVSEGVKNLAAWNIASQKFLDVSGHNN